MAIDLLAFFADRLKVYLRDKGARYDLIDAVFALPGQDDLLMIVRRVEALGRFLDTDDGKNLLVGYRRAANIVRAEEKKDGEGAFAGAHDPLLLVLPEEKALADALAAAGAEARERVAREDFEGAMRALAALRAPVDAFFLDVTVNADDPALAAQPPAPARRAARGGSRGRGFFEDRGVTPLIRPPSPFGLRRLPSPASGRRILSGGGEADGGAGGDEAAERHAVDAAGDFFDGEIHLDQRVGAVFLGLAHESAEHGLPIRLGVRRARRAPLPHGLDAAERIMGAAVIERAGKTDLHGIDRSLGLVGSYAPANLSLALMGA